MSLTNRTASPADKQYSAIRNDDTREKMLQKRQQLLQTYYDSLKNQVKQSEKDLEKATQQRQQVEKELEKAKHQNEELKVKLKETQSTLYESTKPIRVTDDDFSTIIATMGKFFGKVTNFLPKAKSAFRHMQNPEQTKLFFSGLFEKDADRIQYLFDIHSSPGKTDYMLVSLLVERYLTEKIVSSVLKTGIHLDQATNESFNRLNSLFVDSKHEGWAKDLRLKTAKATAELIQRKDPHTLATIEQAKKAIVKEIETTLTPLYDMTTDVVQSIAKLVNMASDLCLPMNGQDDAISIHTLCADDKVIAHQVKHVYCHLEQKEQDSEKIYLGITPVFLAKSTVEADDDVALDSYIEHYTLVYAGRAIW